MPTQNGLQIAGDLFLLLRGRSSLCGTSGISSPQPFSTLANRVSLFSRSGSGTIVGRDPRTIDWGKAVNILEALSRRIPVPSSSGPSAQVSQYHINCFFSESSQSSFCGPVRRKLMAACSSLLGGAELAARRLENLNRKITLTPRITTWVDHPFRSRTIESCSRVSASLKNQEPCGNNMVYKCLWSNTASKLGHSIPFVESATQDFHTSCSAQYSAGAAPDMSFDGSVREEQVENPAVSSDQKVLGDRTLKLISGSCYLPHPAKEDTGGEDAHFICADEQAIGVADGVGGWADLGVDAGQYARELMSHSVSAIQDEPKGSIDPSRVLEKAYSSTKAKGSSTACIIALTDQGIHAVNLGDSGFIVVRDGCTIFRSPVQQHDFNFTYQLESGNGSDLPSAAQVFTFPVAPGDVVIAGTDGLFDNLYNNEVTAVVVHAIRAGLGPQVTAQKIAALARQRAQDKDRQTPFSTAAQDAGYRYYGGKLDDITVIVSYITSSNA